jgi:tryptophan 2,3-dioxygenase
VTDAAVSYSSYLRIDELLAVQTPLSEGPEHDELLFITIHQVYELWFKQLLHELAGAQRFLESGDTMAALHVLRRVRAILKVLVSQVDVLETMTPRSFASFRTVLGRGSGFQSAQFRELEAVLGRRDRSVLGHHPDGPPRDRIAAALDRPAVFASFLVWVRSRGHAVPEDAVQDALVTAYDDPEVAEMAERLLDIDEGLQEWRYRHVKMVERVIGHLPGTGGSDGAAYLQKTLFQPSFPDLWAIRSRF